MNLLFALSTLRELLRNRFPALLLILCGWPEASTALAQSLLAVGAWGDNSYGQTTVPVAAQSGVTAIAAGDSHTVALKKDGSVVAWGNNSDGQTTVPVSAQSSVTAIAAGGWHTVALRNDGSVVAWGNNSYGQTTVPGAAQSGVTAIAAGAYHTVALKKDGSVVAWGADFYGQTTVAPGLTGVTAIAAGYGHTAALRDDGLVVAWGWNISGQVTGTPTPYSATANPVTLGGQVLTGVTAIALGGTFSVALKKDGSVVAWGYSGQTSVPVAAQSDVTAIAAGPYHSVALKKDGSVVPWGYETTVPSGMSGVTAIAAGNGHTVVLAVPTAPVVITQPVSQAVDEGRSASFTVTATGYPLYYQWRKDGVDLAGAMSEAYGLFVSQTNQAGSYTAVVSNPAGTVTSAPPAVLTVNLVPLSIVTDPVSRTISEWRSFSFTVTATGFPLYYQWRKDGVDLAGATNATYSVSLAPTSQAGSYTVVVSDGTGSVTSSPPALLTVNPPPAGSVVTWGLAAEVPLEAESGVAAIAAGSCDIVALKNDSSVIAWGNNSHGLATVPVAAQSGVIAIAAGGYVDTDACCGNHCHGHTLALKNDRTVVAWGDNECGQVTGTNYPGYATASPVTLGGQVLDEVVAVAAGAGRTVALKNDGTVVAWGCTTVPTGLRGVAAIAAGAGHTVALKNDGTVVAWGDNEFGQVTGTAATNDYPYSATASPVTLGGQVLGGVTAIAAGYAHTVALKNDGTVVAWGDNQSGQVTGTAATNDYPYPATASPVTLGGQILGGVTAIAAGAYHTVALTKEGSVVAWGADFYGQTTVPPGLTGVTAIAAGYRHTVVLIGAVPLLPTLNSRLSGNNLILFWPTNVGFTLQSTPTLSPSLTWIDSTNAPAVVGEQFMVTNTISSEGQFYRLRKP